jgi:hypothetical protein
MSPGEFTDALCFSLGLPDGQIVGFKDATGKSDPIILLLLSRSHYNTFISLQVPRNSKARPTRDHAATTVEQPSELKLCITPRPVMAAHTAQQLPY